MAYSKIWRRSAEFTPAAVGAGETTPLFAVKAGMRVLACSLRMLVNADASTDTTLTVGDGVDPDGLIASVDTETATYVDGQGAYMANAGGKLYTSDDTIDIVYDEGSLAGATAPRCRVTVTFIRDEE